MNCHDIGRLLDSGKFAALSAGERRDAEAHAYTCRHCAPRWGVHARMVEMRISPMPPEFAAQIQALVAARGRGKVLRFVPRQMMVVVAGFVVLAAAAAVVTMQYVAPALRRAEASAPVARPPAPVLPRPFAPTLVADPAPPVQQVVQGEQDMNRTSTFAVAAAIVGAAVAADPPAAPDRATGGMSSATVLQSDIESGKNTFKTMCGVCHAVQAVGGPTLGPNLLGVLDRQAGTESRFTSYTRALRDSRITWDRNSLDKYLLNPMAAVPGTTMPMQIPDNKTREDVVGYLATLK